MSRQPDSNTSAGNSPAYNDGTTLEELRIPMRPDGAVRKPRPRPMSRTVRFAPSALRVLGQRWEEGLEALDLRRSARTPEQQAMVDAILRCHDITQRAEHEALRRERDRKRIQLPPRSTRREHDRDHQRHPRGRTPRRARSTTAGRDDGDDGPGDPDAPLYPSTARHGDLVPAGDFLGAIFGRQIGGDR